MAAKKLPGLAGVRAAPKAIPKTPKPRTVARLREALPPAVGPGSRGRGDGVPFQVVLPEVTVRELRVRAAEEGTSARALILTALKKAGFNVPPGEAIDRRRPGGRA